MRRKTRYLNDAMLSVSKIEFNGNIVIGNIKLNHPNGSVVGGVFGLNTKMNSRNLGFFYSTIFDKLKC